MRQELGPEGELRYVSAEFHYADGDLMLSSASIGPRNSSDIQGGNSNAKEIFKSIRAFDKWFRYAETIGQTRLYNFLMAFSILLAACSVLLGIKSFGTTMLAGVIAVGGIIVCLWSVTLGNRQIKFHQMIEANICELMERYEKLPEPKTDIRLLPVHSVIVLKKCGHTCELEEPELLSPGKKVFELTEAEYKLSARHFLPAVPKVFAFLFALTLAVSLIQLAMEIVVAIANRKSELNV
jgi:hypothetical protein